ncbi:MAG: hypothetical protein AAGA29_11965 [Planctomycetota bacterium]
MKTTATLAALALTAAVSTAWAGPDAAEEAGDTPTTPLGILELAPAAEAPAQEGVVMSLQLTDGDPTQLEAIGSPREMTWSWEYNDEGGIGELAYRGVGTNQRVNENSYTYNEQGVLVAVVEYDRYPNSFERTVTPPDCASYPEYVESNLYAQLPLILSYHLDQGHEAFSTRLRGPQNHYANNAGGGMVSRDRKTSFQLSGEAIGAETLEVDGEAVEVEMFLLTLEPDETSDLVCDTTYLQVFLDADGRILRLTAECGDAFAEYEAVTLPVDEAPAGDDEADE